MKFDAQLGIVEKVTSALVSGAYDAVLAVGPDNVAYLTGAQLPFHYSAPDRFVAVFWPKSRRPTCLAHAAWANTVHDLGRIDRVLAYSGDGPDAADTVAGLIAELVRESMQETAGVSARMIGVDLDRASEQFCRALEAALPEVTLADASGWFRDLRMVKTQGEIALMEELAYRTDHGILGACHHVLTSGWRPEKGMSEITRVHCLERDLDAVGYDMMGQAASGANATKFWPLAPRYGIGWGKLLEVGEFVRISMATSLDGYRSDACRMMVMGEPTEAQTVTYDHLVALRQTAVEAMRPGVPCSAVHRAVLEAARTRGARLITDLGFGHGVGVTTFEPPYLTATDDTPLQAGMVLVLDLIVRGPEEELVRAKDTVVITESGCRVVGWYKDWREPYLASTAYSTG